MRNPGRCALVLSALMGASLYACGDSGSSPVEFPEVRIEVRPAGPATFRVESLIGGGNNHLSVRGQEFAATSVFAFVLENAGPPYEARFTRLSGGDITVVLTLISATGQTQVTDATGAGKDTATVVAGGTSPIPTPVPGRIEVRFDVCAPAAGGTCLGSPGADAGTFGVLFSGTVGDQFDSHVLNGATPTIHFLEGARDNVNAVFTRLSFTGDPLVVHLLIDGQLHQTGASAADVVIREDL